MSEQSPDLAVVVRRLEELERQNRRFKWVVVGLGLFVLTAAALWTVSRLRPSVERPQPKHVDAVSLLLWEAGERPTVSVSATRGTRNSHEVELTIQDRGWGSDRGRLRMDAHGTDLELYDEDKRTRVRLGYGKDQSGLVLLDEEGRTRAELICGKEGPALRLFDATGKPVFSQP